MSDEQGARNSAPPNPPGRELYPSGDARDMLHGYLALGWALLPVHDVTAGRCSCVSARRLECKTPGKHPVLKEWQRPENLIFTAEQLDAALCDRPSCNWGLATGLVSSIWVIDYDPKHVTDPVVAGAFLLRLWSAGTRVHRTGSGGLHFLFALPTDFVPNNSAKRLPDGFDVRGARRGEVGGGQVLLPPSVNASGPYAVLAGGPVVAAPDDVTELVRPAPPRVRTAPVSVGVVSNDAAGRYVTKAIDGELGDLRGCRSRRNDRAWQAATRTIELANTGLADREAVYSAWWAAAVAHPDPAVTVPDSELVSVWASAERHVGDRPADLSGVGGAPGWAGGAGVAPFAAGDAALSSAPTGSAGGAPALGMAGTRAAAPTAPGPVAAVEPNGHRQLRVVRADSIRMRATRWLWAEDDAHWMPLGGLTLLGGREGIGKSTWAYRLAALLTVGKLPGSFFGEPRAVVVVAGEDAWAQTVVPRLAAAGADLSLVFRVDVVQPDGGVDGLSLPEDTAGLTALCHEQRVGLILLDPLMTVVSGKLDSHKDAEVRKALTPLSRLADEAQAGVLGLIHVNKSQGNDLLTRLMGSRAFSAVARSVLVCSAEDGHEDDGGSSFLFGQAKSNLARKVGFSYRYVIEGMQVGWDDDLGLPVWSSRVLVRDRVDGGIDDQVADQEQPARTAPKTAAAAAWLIELLTAHAATTDRNGLPSSEVKAAAAAAGHGERALRNAREKSGGKVVTSHNPNGLGTVWHLSSSV